MTKQEKQIEEIKNKEICLLKKMTKLDEERKKILGIWETRLSDEFLDYNKSIKDTDLYKAIESTYWEIDYFDSTNIWFTTNMYRFLTTNYIIKTKKGFYEMIGIKNLLKNFIKAK